MIFIFLIFIVLLIFGLLLYPFFLVKRNKKVYYFLKDVSHKCYLYNIYWIKHGKKKECAWERWYYKLPSYDELLYSSKELGLDTFFTKNEIEELLLIKVSTDLKEKKLCIC